MKTLLIPYFVTAVVVATVSTPAVLAQHTFSKEASHCKGILSAQDRSSQIILRSGPGRHFRSLGYGLVGDRVQVLSAVPGKPEVDYREDRNGEGWIRVGFPRSGAKGWIYGNFINFDCSK